MKENNTTSSMYANETWSADRIKELTMDKIHCAAVDADRYAPRHVVRRFAAVVIAVVLMLSLATVALAASGIISFPSIINSIFHSKNAAPYIQTGDGIRMTSDDGEVSIESIAAFYEVSRSGMYLELKITDPTDIRLSDLLMFIDMESGNNGRMINVGPVDVRFVDDNTVIAGMLVTPVDIGETTIRFDTIVSGIEQFDTAQLTGFNIGEHLGIAEPIVVPGAEIVEITEITLNNGRLTIAHNHSDVSVYGWGSATLGLLLPDGETIWSNSGAVGVDVRGQQDFFEIGSLDPNDLTLIWIGTRAENTIIGKWEFTVTGENIISPRILNGVFEGNNVEVTLGATVVEIRILADYMSTDFPYDYHTEDAVTLLLKDGTTVHTRVESIMCDNTMASFTYAMSFIDPTDVVSVTFYRVSFIG